MPRISFLSSLLDCAALIDHASLHSFLDRALCTLASIILTLIIFSLSCFKSASSDLFPDLLFNGIMSSASLDVVLPKHVFPGILSFLPVNDIVHVLEASNRLNDEVPPLIHELTIGTVEQMNLASSERFPNIRIIEFASPIMEEADSRLVSFHSWHHFLAWNK